MIRVFFDYGSTTEWVAAFADEKTYAVCVPRLEKQAAQNKAKLVESVWVKPTKKVND